MPGAEEAAAMYRAASQMLTGAGLEHYEISNFDRPGHRCAAWPVHLCCCCRRVRLQTHPRRQGLAAACRQECSSLEQGSCPVLLGPGSERC